MELDILTGLVLTVVPILLSLTVHEVAHARTALAFGDPTAKLMGRCSPNPLRHLDLVGTLMIVMVGFGWAKPVPVLPENLSPRRMGSFAVSLAGPASNVAILLLCAFSLRALTLNGVQVDVEAPVRPLDIVVFILIFSAILNLALAMFNMIPLFPLDGHHIGRELLPAHRRADYMNWQLRYGRWLFVALWIGPFLLRGILPAGWNPLALMFGLGLNEVLPELLGLDALLMGFDAMDKFANYIPWW